MSSEEIPLYKKILDYIEKNPFEESGYKTKIAYREKVAEIFGTSQEYVRKAHTKQNNKLVRVKETTHPKGDQTTVDRLMDTNQSDKTGMVLKGVTTNPNGGEWRKYAIDVDWQDIFENLKKELQGVKIPKVKKVSSDFTSYCAIVNIYDIHLDKLPVMPSSGVGSLEDNIKTLDHYFNELLADIQDCNPEKILFPIGSDLFHTNWFNSKTKKGTELEYYCNPEIAYARICKWIVEKIVQLQSLSKELVVIPLKGNHDQDKVVTLKVWLDVLFGDFEDVIIENQIPLNQRVGYKYGKNLFGFGHGDKEKGKIAKIPVLMAIDFKEYWASTERRHFYCGDLHHEFQYNFLSNKDMPGVKVEFLRSAGVDDQWHKDHGWTGTPRMMYVDLWAKGDGKKMRIEYEIKNRA